MGVGSLLHGRVLERLGRLSHPDRIAGECLGHGHEDNGDDRGHVIILLLVLMIMLAGNQVVRASVVVQRHRDGRKGGSKHWKGRDSVSQDAAVGDRCARWAEAAQLRVDGWCD